MKKEGCGRVCETSGALSIGASEVPICSERAAEIKIGGDGERGAKGKESKFPVRNGTLASAKLHYSKSCMHGSDCSSHPRNREGRRRSGRWAPVTLCSGKGADGVTRVEPGGAGEEERPFGKGSAFVSCYTRFSSADFGRDGVKLDDCPCDRLEHVILSHPNLAGLLRRKRRSSPRRVHPSAFVE